MVRNGEKYAFQAEYEGSIPFTRSNQFNILTPIRIGSACLITAWDHDWTTHPLTLGRRTDDPPRKFIPNET